MKRPAAALLASLLLAAACGGREEEGGVESPGEPAAAAEPFEEELLPSPRPGLEIRRLAPPHGTKFAQGGEEVLLDLVILEGGEVEWSGRFGFRLGSGQGSPALDDGVTGSAIGEARRVTVGVRPGRETATAPPPGRRVYEFTVLDIQSGASSPPGGPNDPAHGNAVSPESNRH